MNALSILESGYVIETTFATFVRDMQPYSPVETDHEKPHVISQSHACAYSQLPETFLQVELAARSAWVIMQRPNIPGIHE